MHKKILLGLACALGSVSIAAAQPAWSGFAGNAQHTALSTVASDPLSSIRWSTPVDDAPQYSGDELLIHYGSPVITADNTVIVPVKTTASGGYGVEAINASNGNTIWNSTTSFVQPPAGWTPSYAPALSPDNTLFYPGPGGTIYARTDPDAASGPSVSTTQISFFGNSAYNANPSAYNSSVYISTPITSDQAGDIYFGYRVTGSTPLGSALASSGIARISPTGPGTYSATYTPVSTAANDPSMNSTVMNGAPALSSDGSKLYVAVSNVNPVTGQSALSANGDLVELNATTLAPIKSVPLNDPKTSNPASLPDDGTASVTVGPDGDVYLGVLGNQYYSNDYRGYLLHFSSNLSQTTAQANTPGDFGWDDTASVVPRSMVPSYHGTSSYLLMTKYNNYARGGDGVNKIAILDPNATDPVTGNMQVVESIAGPTPDTEAIDEGFPLAVKEWCINSAVVDPATDSVLVNSEDGNLYRWDLATDTLTEQITLTSGIGEAYTSTLIGPDGSIYATNNAVLFSVVPEPASISILLAGTLILATRRRRQSSRFAKPDRGHGAMFPAALN
jgi:hypothetical protein